jgi:hydroxypyruvate isomerase
MKWNDYEVSANISLLFAELPYEQRFRAAADAGFTAVESWWPFAQPHPGEARLDELVGLIEEAGVRLTGLNFFAGDMPAGERGVACRRERHSQLDANIDAVLHLARATGCRGFNLLYGQIDEESAPQVHRVAAVAAFRRAAEAVAVVDGVVLAEPLASGLNGAYPLTDHDDVVHLLDEIASDHVALLFDTFHLASNGVEIPGAITELAGRIGHVQLADVPDRGEPGSGSLDWAAVGNALRDVGYDGTVAAEYKPKRETTSTLGWAMSVR